MRNTTHDHPESLRADFQVVPYVSRRNAPVGTAASFLVEAGDPALRRL